MSAEREVPTLRAALKDDDGARALLENVRWPRGVVCPHCGNSGIEAAWRITARADSQTSARPGLWKCRRCRKQFTVTIGTIFQGGHLPLHKVLSAIPASASGAPALRIAASLGVNYRTAFALAQKIRRAAERDPLTSSVVAVLRGSPEERQILGLLGGTAGTDPRSEDMVWPFVAGAPLVPEHDLLLLINASLPRNINEEVRQEAGQNLAVAVLSGELNIEEVRAAAPFFVKQAVKACPATRWNGWLSLDAKLWRNSRLTRVDAIAHDLGDSEEAYS